MKKVFFFYIILGTIFSFAQTNEYVLVFKDKSTGQLIQNVMVKLARTNENFISNPEGRVKFKLTSATKIDISHDEYKSISLTSKKIQPKENIIELQPIAQEIEDVVITSKKPNLILKNLITKSMKQLTAPINLKIYTREFFKYNSEYTSYSDGLVNFCLKEKPDKFAADILVEQNRTYALINNEEIEKKTLSYNMYDIIGNYYDFKYIKFLTENKAHKKFDFEIKTVRGNDELYRMVIKPKAEVEEFLPEITVLYNFVKSMILEINYDVDPQRIEYSDVSNLKVVKGKIFKSSFNVLFIEDGEDYFLVSSKEEIGLVSRNKKDEEVKIEVTNYLITTKQSRKFVPYQKEDVFKEKSLINKKNAIFTEYWETNSGYLLTQDEKKIVDNLQLNDE
ncbi:hypothetical protein [Flavobacterium urocaniciphilum]|uniref:CarboxypepD_reg-like domain-containing protein n=1 Tax=Flavobacterium urocaniciphilum TaxID=1299341 RepID=A0A1H8Z1B0_9FLAO|nr:hypothetical protein [Flavobacterium urocaniciphilum]SEP58143.1 hypothetical protein SAMN05444005_101420 [Flavobacterium urocaniciphilum]